MKNFPAIKKYCVTFLKHQTTMFINEASRHLAYVVIMKGDRYEWRKQIVNNIYF